MSFCPTLYGLCTEFHMCKEVAYALVGWLGDKKPTYRCLEGFQKKKNKPFAFLLSTKEG